MIIDFFKGFIVGLFASIPLGPIGVICIQRTLSKGRFSGFISGMGATMVDVIFAAISLLSLSVVQVLLEEYRNVVMIAGGVIVALFGVKLFLSTPIKQMRRLQEGGRSFLTDFSSTMLMTITNPCAFFLILGLFAFAGINTSDSATLDYIAVTLLGVFTGGGLWWYSLSTGINLFRNKIRLRQMILINKVAGIIVIAIGFCYLVEGVYKLLV